MGDDPPLPVTDCLVDPAIPAPAAVASGGGSLFVADWGGDQGGNLAIPLPIVESNRDFDAAARQAGYDVELIVVPGGHLEPTAPGTEPFATWVETVAEIAHAVS